MTNPIQKLLREPAAALSLDMGLGSREQGFATHRPKRVRFILSEQAHVCGAEAVEL